MNNPSIDDLRETEKNTKCILKRIKKKHEFICWILYKNPTASTSKIIIKIWQISWELYSNSKTYLTDHPTKSSSSKLQVLKFLTQIPDSGSETGRLLSSSSAAANFCTEHATNQTNEEKMLVNLLRV